MMLWKHVIHAIHHPAVLIHNVETRIEFRHAHAYPLISELHQTVDRNASLTKNVQAARLAYVKNVKIHVWVLVDWVRNAQ